MNLVIALNCCFWEYGVGGRSHIWQSAKMPKRSCILCPIISYLSFLFRYLYVDNRITMYCLNIFLILFFAITITKILNKIYYAQRLFLLTHIIHIIALIPICLYASHILWKYPKYYFNFKLM